MFSKWKGRSVSEPAYPSGPIIGQKAWTVDCARKVFVHVQKKKKLDDCIIDGYTLRTEIDKFRYFMNEEKRNRKRCKREEEEK